MAQAYDPLGRVQNTAVVVAGDYCGRWGTVLGVGREQKKTLPVQLWPTRQWGIEKKNLPVGSVKILDPSDLADFQVPPHDSSLSHGSWTPRGFEPPMPRRAVVPWCAGG